MELLKGEFEKVKAEDFSLRFRYPTEEERKTMKMVNRDMSKAEQLMSAKRRSDLAEILEALATGESVLEDFPEEMVEQLEHLLSTRKKPRRR